MHLFIFLQPLQFHCLSYIFQIYPLESHLRQRASKYRASTLLHQYSTCVCIVFYFSYCSFVFIVIVFVFIVLQFCFYCYCCYFYCFRCYCFCFLLLLLLLLLFLVLFYGSLFVSACSCLTTNMRHRGVDGSIYERYTQKTIE